MLLVENLLSWSDLPAARFGVHEPCPCYWRCHHMQAHTALPILFPFPQDGEVDFSEFLACLLDWSKVRRAFLQVYIVKELGGSAVVYPHLPLRLSWQLQQSDEWLAMVDRSSNLPKLCLHAPVFKRMVRLLVFVPCSCNSRTSGWAWWTAPTSRWTATAAAASGPKTWRSCCAAMAAARCALLVG